MIFEAAGLGTQRYDAVSELRAPDVILIVRTRIDVAKDIQELMQSMLLAWKEMFSSYVLDPVIKIQCYGDQTADGCFALCTTMDWTDSTAPLAESALSLYRRTVSNYRTEGPQPPLTHEICFLPSGKTLQYQGKE